METASFIVIIYEADTARWWFVFLLLAQAARQNAFARAIEFAVALWNHAFNERLILRRVVWVCFRSHKLSLLFFLKSWGLGWRQLAFRPQDSLYLVNGWLECPSAVVPIVLVIPQNKAVCSLVVSTFEQ